ncbi:hypothetical protein CMK20_14415 [Candidatus Poribacteria bacterium]|nr:hypothetical protein [Candidatus Poribacteria bacterium]
MLTPRQIDEYQEQGYLLAEDLIPDQVSKKARDKLWSLLEMQPDQPESWETVPKWANVQSYRNLIDITTTDSDLLACCTPEFMQASSQLTSDPSVATHYPSGINTINVFPSPTWWCGKAHIDGIELGGKKYRKSLPGPLRMVVLTFLSDTADKGGGTMVWPKSHHKIRALAESDKEKYHYLIDLHNDLNTLNLGGAVELQPKRGDVLFFQHMFAHAGTANTSSIPRFAFRYLCTCRLCERWSHSAEWNLWTP